MPRQLIIAPLAEADLEEIGDYIAQDNPDRALSFIDELEATCRAVAASPLLHPARPDVAPGLRVAVHRRYLILYRDLPDEDAVRVERVVHSARDWARLV